jgi:hypothetical protein
MSKPIVPQEDKRAPVLQGQEKAKQVRAAYTARASADFYGAVGWIAGLLLTALVSLPIIWLLYNNASSASRSDVLLYGVAAAWWLNPLSLGGLGYVMSNARAWRWWAILGVLVWAFVNALISAAIVSNVARVMIINGFIALGYLILGLLFLYVQLRVFIWAAAGKPARFFFGILGWSALNGLVYWAIVSPEVLNLVIVILVHGSLACRDDPPRRPKTDYL